jgi:hypothetical protein
MNTILEFRELIKKRRFSSDQFSFGERITQEEKEAFPYCVLYVVHRTDEPNAFAVELSHSCVIEDISDEESDPTLGTFDAPMYVDQIPRVQLHLDELCLFNEKATASSITETILMHAIYQYGQFTIDRLMLNGPVRVHLECEAYSGEMEVFANMKRGLPLHANLAGGIITSSFIVEGTVHRSLSDLPN